jgi:hypothetical protein
VTFVSTGVLSGGVFLNHERESLAVVCYTAWQTGLCLSQFGHLSSVLTVAVRSVAHDHIVYVEQETAQ